MSTGGKSQRGSRANRPGKAPPAKRGGRRAFAAIDRGGRTGYDGPADIGKKLVRALAPSRATRQRIGGELTHSFHSYPARMHPATARAVIEGLAPRRVLDPFCGSGTTLVEARRVGASAVGGDINPLGLLVARAKTFTGNRRERERLLRAAESIAEAAVQAGKAARRSEGKQARKKRKPDPLTAWFPRHVYPELRFLEAQIAEFAESSSTAADSADVLRAALSAILHKVSLRASDSDPRKVTRNIARGAAARLFVDRVRQLLDGLDALSEKRGPRPELIQCDARQIADHVEHGTFDAVVTSPPYAGTYNYVTHHELRMKFLGLSATSMKREIGSRSSFEAADFARALAAFESGLTASVSQIERALSPGGVAAMVLGDSIAGRRAIRAPRLVDKAIAGSELSLEAHAWQERPPVSSAERTAFARVAKREYLFLLRRG